MDMRRLPRVVRLRLRSIFRRGVVEDELMNEIRFHLDERAREFVNRGMSAADAHDAAERAFGGVEQRKEECRDARRLGFLEDAVHDVRYSLRMMRRSRGFTAVALISLALGIGANTAIFTAIDTVMLRKLPLPAPDALVGLRWTAATYPQAFVSSLQGGRYPNDHGTDVFSYTTFEQLVEANEHEGFDTVFAFTGDAARVNVGLSTGAAAATALGVSGNYFAGVGVPALLGRTLAPADDRVGAPPAAVASYTFWQTTLGASPAAIGGSIVVNGQPLTIVGVTPASFFGLEPGLSPDLWVPLRVYAHNPSSSNVSNLSSGGSRPAATLPLLVDPKTWWLRIAARLKPGGSPERSLAAARVVFERSIGRVDQLDSTEVPQLQIASIARGIDTLRQSVSGSLLLLMEIVGLVLLIACANLAALLLERSRAREREIAVRLSLGVSRFRLVRQFLTESLVLALLGGVAALVIASWTYPLLMALLSSGQVAPHLVFALDGRILAFAGVVSIAAGIVFGLAPALHASRHDLAGGLKQRVATSGHAKGITTGKLLVGTQVAVSLVLLVGAGLFVRTLDRLHGADLGFDRDNLLLFTVAPGSNGYAEARLFTYYDAVRQRLSGVAGVGRSPWHGGRHWVAVPDVRAVASWGRCPETKAWTFIGTRSAPTISRHSASRSSPVARLMIATRAVAHT